MKTYSTLFVDLLTKCESTTAAEITSVERCGLVDHQPLRQKITWYVGRCVDYVLDYVDYVDYGVINQTTEQTHGECKARRNTWKKSVQKSHSVKTHYENVSWGRNRPVHRSRTGEGGGGGGAKGAEEQEIKLFSSHKSVRYTTVE